MTPPEHTAALHVCQADLRAAVNDILREAQPQLLQPQLLSPQPLPPPAAAAADGAPAVAPQQVSSFTTENLAMSWVGPSAILVLSSVGLTQCLCLVPLQRAADVLKVARPAACASVADRA